MIAEACDEDRVVAIDLAEGRRNDAPLAKGVLFHAVDAIRGVAEVLGDKGFDADAVRGVVRDGLDALPLIPTLSGRKEPWPWHDERREIEKQWSRVERAFAKADPFRRFAARYENMKDVYVAVAQIVFGFILVLVRKPSRRADANPPVPSPA